MDGLVCIFVNNYDLLVYDLWIVFNGNDIGVYNCV